MREGFEGVSDGAQALGFSLQGGLGAAAGTTRHQIPRISQRLLRKSPRFEPEGKGGRQKNTPPDPGSGNRVHSVWHEPLRGQTLAGQRELETGSCGLLIRAGPI